jgi:hypothetical protein
MKLWSIFGLALALSGAAAACGSDDGGGSSSTGGTGGAGGAGGSGTGGGGSGNCPADPLGAEGQGCSVAGQTCGKCADSCAGCDVVTCIGGLWKKTAVPPDPSACADGGQKNWCSTESTVLCKSNEFCDYSDVCGLTKTGYCSAKPTTCDTACTNVCGCDGNAYCNECEAHKAGVDVDPTASKCGDGGGSDAGSDASPDAPGDAAADSGGDAATD